MTSDASDPRTTPPTPPAPPAPGVADAVAGEPPRPSPQFRRRAWRDFQRAIDPLAPPKPLPQPRQH